MFCTKRVDLAAGCSRTLPLQMHFPVKIVKQISAYCRAAAEPRNSFVTVIEAVGMHQTRQSLTGVVCRGRNGGTS